MKQYIFFLIIMISNICAMNQPEDKQAQTPHIPQAVLDEYHRRCIEDHRQELSEIATIWIRLEEEARTRANQETHTTVTPSTSAPTTQFAHYQSKNYRPS